MEFKFKYILLLMRLSSFRIYLFHPILAKLKVKYLRNKNHDISIN